MNFETIFWDGLFLQSFYLIEYFLSKQLTIFRPSSMKKKIIRMPKGKYGIFTDITVIL